MGGDECLDARRVTTGRGSGDEHVSGAFDDRAFGRIVGPGAVGEQNDCHAAL